MIQRRDITGLKSGKLTAIRYSHSVNRKQKWVASCECGNEMVIIASSIIYGRAKSCGCSRRGARVKNRDHSLYHVWLSMRDRCNNPNNKFYHRYGGRGIKVCERWDSYESFFADVINGYVRGLQLDRIENDNGYHPGNFRWSTRAENMRNSPSAKLNLSQVNEIRGSTDGLRELAIKYGVAKSTIRDIKKRRTWA